MELVIWAGAWLLGMAAVGVWGAPGWMVAAWFVAVTPAAGLVRGRKWAVVVGVAAVFALVGGMRFEAWQGRPDPSIVRYIGQTVTLEAVVDSEPDPGQQSQAYRLAVTGIRKQGTWEPADGAVLASLHQYAEHEPGERVRVTGELELPPVFEDFDYRGYLARQGIVATMRRPQVEVLEEAPRWDGQRLAADARLRLEDSLERSLPEPEASLAASIAFGRDGNLPRAVYEDFRATGLAHLVAVSGSNVALVAGSVFFALRPLMGRRKAAWPAAAMILLYVFAAGASGTIVRAGIMASVFLVGELLGRQQSGLAALGVAAVVMTGLHPGIAAEIGFQLSVAATAGVLAFGPWVREGIREGARRARVGYLAPEPVVGVAGMSIAATVATLPLMWSAFGQVSLVVVVSNIVAAPLFALVFALSIAAAVAGIVYEPAGWAIGLVAYYPLSLLLWLAATLARVPFASVSLPDASGEAALGAYVALGVAAGVCYRYMAPATPERAWRRQQVTLKRTLVVASAGTAVAALVPVTLLPIGGPGELQVTMLDVGQGDAILITTPHGERYLVDGGPSGIELARELGAALPHWERRIEGVFVSHPQEDHIGGLPEVLRRYDVREAFDNGDRNPTTTQAAYVDRAGTTRTLGRGDSFERDGVRFEVLWPPADYADQNLNERSLVLLVTYGETSVLLTGDFEDEAQRALMALGPVQADVLKVPHHGSKTSAASFLQRVDASVGLISVGAENTFGHPHDATLRALEGVRLYRSDERGRVTVSSNGERLRVRTER